MGKSSKDKDQWVFWLASVLIFFGIAAVIMLALHALGVI